MVLDDACLLPDPVSTATPREPPSWVAETRRRPATVERPAARWRPRLLRAALVLIGLALPCLARQVPLLSFQGEWTIFVPAPSAPVRQQVGGWALQLFYDCHVLPTAAGFGLEPYALAVGLGSAFACIVSCGRRRRLRGWGLVYTGVALVGFLVTTGILWSSWQPWTVMGLTAWASLPLPLVGVAVARRVGVSVNALSLGLATVASSVGSVLCWGPMKEPWVIRSVAVEVLCAIALVAGGLWLVRRHRVAECDLSGLLSGCPAAAEVALLPWAWCHLARVALDFSRYWTREVTWGLGVYDLHAALESRPGRCATDLLLAAGALTALALVLRARDRRDRGLALAGGAA